MLNTKDNRVLPCSRREPTVKTFTQIIEELFDWQSAESLKQELWRWYITALGSPDMDGWSAEQRSNLAYLYKQLSELVSELDSIHLKKTA